ncbi:MAG: DUF952 domain-containing protein [Cyanobium sp.]
MDERPILWSFRRCPYAIRARLAIAAAGVVVELREVDLACKPPELLEIWPPGTVPVLQTAEGEVIGASLAVMRWALARRDPQHWLELPAADEPLAAALSGPGRPQIRGRPGPLDGDLPGPIAALIAENDGAFKHHLDRTKYPSRHPGAIASDHRREALLILRRRQALLRSSSGLSPHPSPIGTPDGAESMGWLLGLRPCLADMALLPFVRQFRLADPHAFAAEPGLEALRRWLARYEQGPELAAAMAPPLAPRQPWRSPRWLYHLALSEEWRQARAEGVYRRSTRGLSLEQVGFIHASHAHQIAATYARFYADAGSVRLLTIDPQRLQAAAVTVREEPAAEGSGELFPHLYGALPVEAVLAAEPYRP